MSCMRAGEVVVWLRRGRPLPPNPLSLCDKRHRVWGLAQGSVLFALDLATGEVVFSEDFSHHEVERHLFAHGGQIYACFHTAIVRVDPASFEHEVVARPPTDFKVGGPVIDGRLYYTSEAHLWSFELPG